MIMRMIKAEENEVILAVEETAEEVSCAAEVVDGRTTAGEWWWMYPCRLLLLLLRFLISFMFPFYLNTSLCGLVSVFPIHF